jgi:Epoxide hydrolase N terminus
MSATRAAQQASGENTAVRPFEVGFPEAELTDLRRRINATRWPERETVSDDSQGARLAMMQDLARYWGTDYDWGKAEAKLKHCRTSSPRSTGWTSTSFTFARCTVTRCR